MRQMRSSSLSVVSYELIFFMFKESSYGNSLIFLVNSKFLNADHWGRGLPFYC